MPRARKVPVPPPAPSRPAPAWPAALARWGGQFALPLALGAGLLAGLSVLGGWAHEAVRQRRAPLPFSAIACEPPPGLSREEFLEEVQYLANFPDTLDLFDSTLAPRLAGAFSLHPWVGSVERVEKRPGALSVTLRHRVPVLAVLLPGARPGQLPRVVDDEGVLLPASADRAGLPLLRTAPATAPARAGAPWNDPVVQAAARTAGYLAPHRSERGLDGCAVEVQAGEVLLRGEGWLIRWGRPPGEEEAGEPAAEDKLQRLATPLRGEIDLRK